MTVRAFRAREELWSVILMLLLGWLALSATGCLPVETTERRIPSPDGELDALWVFRETGVLGDTAGGLFLTLPGRKAVSGVQVYEFATPIPMDFRWVGNRQLEISYAGGAEPVIAHEVRIPNRREQVEIRLRCVNSPELNSTPAARSRRIAVTQAATLPSLAVRLIAARTDTPESVAITVSDEEELRVSLHASDIENLRVSFFRTLTAHAKDDLEGVSPYEIILDRVDLRSPVIDEVQFVTVQNTNLANSWEHEFLPYRLSPRRSSQA